MKYVTALFCILLIFLCIGCSQTKNVVLNLTKPTGQTAEVDYDGFYILNDGDTTAMTGTTPFDYEFDLSKGDVLEGEVYKADSTNLVDTLVFKIFIDDVEEQSQSLVLPPALGKISFSLTVQ